MSTGASSLTILPSKVERVMVESAQPEIRVETGGSSYVNQQVGVILRETIHQTRERAGASKVRYASLAEAPRTDISEERNRSITVAPGIALSAEEYKQRYEGIDLERFKARMSPDLFRIFVRYMGAIPGQNKLDVNEIASIPE
ncbi:MAG: hypothetical protein Q7T26_07910 [Dehalococcoidia bacterium]|nr:hypothetical protein [Dehalococcoidia bacterium]